MGKIIETKNLKTFFDVPQGKLHAVDDVSLSIEEGTTLGVVGESGCGKSTLGRTILGLIPATSGSVLYEGNDITHMSRSDFYKYRTQLQIIFQDPYSSLNPRMSITQTVEEPLCIYNIYPDRTERTRVVNELLETVGLDKRFAASYPHELDGGRRQRIGIARALALNPKFIVCDEPVSALDVSIQAQILNLLQDLQKDKGLTYMFITHDLSVVRHISDEICVMYRGKVVELSPAKELFKKPLHPYTKALLSAIPVPNIHIKDEPIILKGEVVSPINPKPGCRFATRCDYADKRCFAEDPVLSETKFGHQCACLKTDELNAS